MYCICMEKSEHLRNFSLCVHEWMKVIQFWHKMKMSKWWHRCHSWVNFYVKDFKRVLTILSSFTQLRGRHSKDVTQLLRPTLLRITGSSSHPYERRSWGHQDEGVIGVQIGGHCFNLEETANIRGEYLKLPTNCKLQMLTSTARVHPAEFERTWNSRVSAGAVWPLSLEVPPLCTTMGCPPNRLIRWAGSLPWTARTWKDTQWVDIKQR